MYYASKFEDLFNGTFFDAFEFPYQKVANVKTLDNVYVIDVVAPGLEKEDFKIKVAENKLTIKVDKQLKYQSNKIDYYWQLPDDVDASKVTAKYEAGILVVKIAKLAKKLNPTKEIVVD